MAAIPVILNGVFTSDTGSTTGVFQGTLAYSDRGVGGGPIIPPDKPPSGGGEHPEHPIYWPPGTQPHPEHPIVLPDPPTEIPPGPVGEDGFIKSPPPGGGWGYHPQYAWMYDPGPEQAGPK